MPIRTNIHSHRHIAIVKRRLPKLAANWLRGLFETMQARRPCKRSSHYFRAYPPVPLPTRKVPPPPPPPPQEQKTL